MTTQPKSARSPQEFGSLSAPISIQRQEKRICTVSSLTGKSAPPGNARWLAQAGARLRGRSSMAALAGAPFSVIYSMRFFPKRAHRLLRYLEWVCWRPCSCGFGSEEQKARFLPRMVTLEDWWCQGFSEPSAGSDLASLRTRAVQDGNDWLLNGQKIWTTLAHWADWMFCLVRTSDEPKKQLGISMVLIDMKSPGISVRPIITIDGEHEVNEVFLTDVRVPTANVVGQVGRGWDYAKYLLSHERTGIARVGHSRRQIRRLKAIAAGEHTPTGALGDDPAFRLKVARLEIRLKALELTSLRMLANQQSGVPPGSEANLLKIKGSEIQQDISELMMDAAGHYAFAYDQHAWSDGTHRDPIGPDYAAPLAGVYFNTRKVSIYGGSNEIQRNLLAKLALGL